MFLYIILIIKSFLEVEKLSKLCYNLVFDTIVSIFAHSFSQQCFSLLGFADNCSCTALLT